MGGYSGLIFGIDMMQSAFTGKSLFSAAFGLIAAGLWHRAYPEDKKWGEAWAEFNIWAPCSYTKKWIGRVIEAAWAMGFTIAMSKAIDSLGRAIKNAFSPRVVMEKFFASAAARETTVRCRRARHQR